MTSRDYLVTVWCDNDPEPSFDEKKMKYLMYQKEACPKTGKLHWQCYVIFHVPCRIRGCQKALGLGKGNKVIKPRGSSESCSEYCSKLKTRTTNSSYIEYGVLESISSQGRRTDLETVASKILEGATKTDIATNFPMMYIKYHGGIDKLIQLVPKDEPKSEFEMRWDPIEDIRSTVIIGPAGCGKTEYALAHFKNALFVTHMDDLLRFNNDAHDGIIFDDMDFRHMPRNAQIHLTDWNQDRSLHCRYSVARIPKHTKKIFTCNEYCFTDDAAIRRRVTVTEVN